MALPGLTLPGLGLSQPQSSTGPCVSNSSAAPTIREEDLAPQTEWRFETYTFSGVKGAILTWQGCRLELSGDAESEYQGRETEYAIEWLNVHGMLETARGDAQMMASSEGGPRVLIVGPDAVGKSSFVRSLAGWGVQSGWTPTVVNVDPREGLLTPPGTVSAVTVSSQLSVEDGYAISPISGPTVTPVKAPLVYHCPYSTSTEKPDIFKALLTRTALSVTNKLEENATAKQSGLLIDTPGSLNDPKANYNIITHLVSEFSITLILTIGSERLYNDLNRRFGGNHPDAISILRISKPGGAVEKDASFMKQLQSQQIRQYFFGTSKDSLNPHSHTIGFGELNIWRANSPSLALATNNSNTDDEDDIPYANRPSMSSSGADFERITPSLEMLGRLMAIKVCSGTEMDEVAIRDSSVMGFAYVSEVDEAKKRVRFLSPHPQRWGDRALVWGGFPDAVTDLVG